MLNLNHINEYVYDIQYVVHNFQFVLTMWLSWWSIDLLEGRAGFKNPTAAGQVFCLRAAVWKL
jgi:hypothetical protein